MNTRTRLDADVRKNQILTAAIKEAKRCGFSNITRDAVANTAKVSGGLVSVYFEGMRGLRNAVMRHAVETEDVALVAEGLAERHYHAVRAPEALKREAAAFLAR